MKRKRWITFAGIVGVLALGVCAQVSVPCTLKGKAESGRRTVESFFTGSENVSLQTNANTPSYVTNTQNGVSVRSPNSGVITYNNLLNVSDMTKDNKLLEVKITPVSNGTSEFNQLMVRLEDSEDSNCYINVSLYNYLYNDVAFESIAFVTVKTNTIEEYRSRAYTISSSADTQTETCKVSISKDAQHGSSVYSSFAGANRGFIKPISLYFDYETKMLYTQNSSAWSALGDGVLTRLGLADENGIFPVIDLDSDDMGIAKTNLWTGFPSGKAKLTLTSNSVSADFANYMIYTVNGQTMDGTYISDTTAPKFQVDTGDYENEQPNAIVGKYYPLFNATAVDKMYGKIVVEKHVYYDGEEQFFTGDGFVPTKAGNYTVVYSATDGSGNVASKTIVVEAKESAVAITGTLVVGEKDIDLREQNIEVPMFYPVSLPKMQVSGGNGNVAINLSVTKNGREVSVENNSFIPDSKGDYLIKYQLVDFVGNVKNYQYLISAYYSDVPLLHEPSIPSYITQGKSVLFPAVEAELYQPWKQAITPYTCITVYNANKTNVLAKYENGEAAIFEPSDTFTGKVVVQYAAARDQQSNAVSYEKVVEVLPDTGLVDRFVVEEGAALIQEDLMFDFNYESDGKSISFINPLSVYDGIKIIFIVGNGKEHFDAVRFTFSDKLDGSKQVVVYVYKNSNKNALTSEISVNDGVRTEIGGSFYNQSNILFTIDKDGKVYNSNSDVVAAPLDFDGFSSGFAYMSVDLIGVNGSAGVSLKQIKNQIIGETDSDFIKPILTVLNEPIGEASIGSKVQISPAVASDVFNVQVTLKVTVKYGETVLFTCTDPFGQFDGGEFYANQYGAYTITYLATDASKKTAKREFTIDVKDRIAPRMIVNGSVEKSGNVQSAFSFPDIIVSDNLDTDLTVYVIIVDPMNVFTVIKLDEKYVPKLKGRYVVKFYCEDNTYNIAISDDYIIDVQ